MQDLQNIVTLIYRAEVRKVYKYFYVRVLNRSEAEDLTSDAFFRLLDALKKHEFSSAQEAVKYLYGIVHNVFTEYLKKKYKVKFVDLNLEDILVEVEEIENEDVLTVSEKLQKKLLELLPHLPEKQYYILHARLVEKMALEEICKKIKKDMNYVKTTQKRGIKNLKKLLACTPTSI